MSQKSLTISLTHVVFLKVYIIEPLYLHQKNMDVPSKLKTWLYQLISQLSALKIVIKTMILIFHRGGV